MCGKIERRGSGGRREEEEALRGAEVVRGVKERKKVETHGGRETHTGAQRGSIRSSSPLFAGPSH